MLRMTGETSFWVKGNLKALPSPRGLFTGIVVRGKVDVFIEEAAWHLATTIMLPWLALSWIEQC